MDFILPERLLALVRPAFDLVRRIQSLKRCVGCKITPRMLAIGPRHFKQANLCRAKKKKKTPKKRKKGFLLAKLDLA